MTVIIRKLDKTEHEYFAYAKSFCGKATYIVYFEDTIWEPSPFTTLLKC